ncbi:hypothetical protein TIFTF001_018842 [Ficus carica]|uniref:Uncharacterized protein n=1 Tax=Ficus carica TaxID=3494 RepID=A0AA88DB45_FICCA|nr:hypothetical protein TIFTF001_018842 [Ficus carica]
MSDYVVIEIKEPELVPAGNPMDNSGYVYRGNHASLGRG